MNRLCRFLFLLSLAMPVMTACTQEQDGDSAKAFGDVHVSFSVNDGSYTSTRAALSVTSSFDAGFGVSCSAYTSSTYETQPCGSYFHDITALPDVPTIYYWPAADYRLSFFGYFPKGSSALTVSDAETTGTPIYTYTVPSDVTQQIDFMTAQRTDMPCSEPKTVNLQFTHRCSDIRFSACNQSGETITVKEVAIYGVKYKGTLKGDTWTLVNTLNTASQNSFRFSLEKDVDANKTVDLTGETGHFMMLPQSIAANTATVFVRTVEDGSEKTYTHVMETADSWIMGQSYSYKLLIGKGLSVEVTTDDSWSQKAVGSAEDLGIKDWIEQ